METYSIYLGGEFITTSNSLNVVNPYTDQIFAQTFLAGENELERAIEIAQSAQKQLRNMPSYKRYEILQYISAEIKQKRQYLAEILTQESGKPLRHALVEIDRAAQTFLVASEEAKRLHGEHVLVDWTPSGEGKEGWIKRFPIGVVAGISPFNFPLNLAVHKIAPAIAAGCSIILKPASKTPLSTIELAHIINETSLPKGAVSILPMTRQTGQRLVEDDRFAMLSFTGSPEVGWDMKKKAGRKRVTLELGGNAGVIVSDTAHIPSAVRKCVAGGFSYSGQVCIHVQRIFIHKSVFDHFTYEFVRQTMQLKVGNPMDENTDISVLIDTENAQRVESWVNEAKSNGVRLLCGGNRQGSLYLPTVLTGTKSGLKVRDMEVFGPVVVVEPYEEFEHAIEMINDSRYGLQAGIFTNRLSEMNQAFEHLEVGGVIINDVPSFRVDQMPYGGVKDSGMGREGVRYAMLEMTEPRLLVKNVL